MSDDNDVWAVDDWVPASVKRRSTRVLATVLTLMIIGGGLYLAGIVTIQSALGWILFVSGLLVLLAVIVLVTAANPYRSQIKLTFSRAGSRGSEGPTRTDSRLLAESDRSLIDEPGAADLLPTEQLLVEHDENPLRGHLQPRGGFLDSNHGVITIVGLQQ